MTAHNAKKSSPAFAIIGAGPSGLAIGLFLKQPYEILEAQDQVGGHAASFKAQGFTFDYGPHILFSRDQQILEFIVASLGSNINRCRRHNKISFKDKMLNYPFENNLKALDLEDNYACIHDFIFNPYKEQFTLPSNMKEWFLKTFGKGICSRYLFPYNEKVWNIPVEALSMSMADRIPNPPAEDILKSSLGYNTEGYLHQLYYFYPKTGGYQAISEALKSSSVIHYQFAVEKIEFIDGKIRLSDQVGNKREYEKVISTMPVHELIQKIDSKIPPAIQAAVDKLMVNPMFIISFGIAGVDPNQYTAVYFPDSEFLVNRVSYPCTFSPQNGPKGHWSLQAEITCAKNSVIWNKTDAEILNHTKKGLQERKLLPADDQIVYENIKRIERSYVVYNLGYEENAEILRSWFSSLGIHLLGRFSYFEYINIDMAVKRALQLAINLNGEEENTETKQNYLARALAKLQPKNPN